MNLDPLHRTFKERFHTSGLVYSSPGRINLIGEHTDYNGGFVLPGAIDKAIWCELRENGSDKIRAYSLDMDEYVEFGLQESELPEYLWAKYLFGVCREMIKRGANVRGVDVALVGNVPQGAGMSSSAALESCFGFALNDSFDLGFDRFELALIGQSTEHNYIGVKCGIMDQFASCFGREGSLMLLDCRSLEYEYIPFHPEGYRLVLIDSRVKHELASTAYNRRRESCERVVDILRKYHPAVELLRDATPEMLRDVTHEVSAEDWLRAEFVVEETQRVLETCEALKAGDYITVGKRMYEAHIGLSRKYEVSCEELDFLNDRARECGVTGSRMMGGGFGGCTINLVRDELYNDFIRQATEAYEQKFGIAALVYDVVISDGAKKVDS